MGCVLCNSLKEVRNNIDRIDNEIIKLIAERGKYVEQASKFKKSESNVKAPDRVNAVIEKARAKAYDYGADADMIEALYKEMISHFIDAELSLFNKSKGN